MVSIRQLASCINVTGSFSILSHFFGFFRGRIPPDPTGITLKVSLKEQASLLQGKHFHLNIIAVGSDNFTDPDDYIEIDYAIHKIRNIYSQVNIGIGRVEHYYILSSDADGLDSPTTKGELEEITDTWSVPNNGIDVFIPQNMNVPSNNGIILGRSAIGGPCEEKADWGMNGSVAGLWGSEQTARTFSHEVGHYLGERHKNSNPDNLMCQSSEIVPNTTRDSVVLWNSQGDDMKDHCLVKPGC